ncbi:MAG: hypothetical protein ACOC5T_00850 [Elusimicrobiota bacterium]
MSISADNAKMTLDFTYQYEDEDGNIEQNMYVRYYISDEYGPTIAISADQEKYVGYPAEMFNEIVEFIDSQLGRSKGKDKRIIKQDEVERERVVSKNSSLPLPNIGKGQEDKPSDVISTNIETNNATDKEPIQSFNSSVAPETESSYKTEERNDGNNDDDQELDDYTEEEIQAMWQAREEAIQKAKKSQKRIKTNHLPVEDEDE